MGVRGGDKELRKGGGLDAGEVGGGGSGSRSVGAGLHQCSAGRERGRRETITAAVRSVCIETRTIQTNSMRGWASVSDSQPSPEHVIMLLFTHSSA